MFLIRAVIHNWWQTAFRHLLFIPTCWLFRAKLRSPASGWRVAAEKNRLTFFSHSFDRFWTNGSSQTLAAAAAYKNNSQQLFVAQRKYIFSSSTFSLFLVYDLVRCERRKSENNDGILNGERVPTSAVLFSVLGTFFFFFFGGVLQFSIHFQDQNSLAVRWKHAFAVWTHFAMVFRMEERSLATAPAEKKRESMREGFGLVLRTKPCTEQVAAKVI